MKYDELIRWLLEGDVSIQYQVHRDLLDSEDKQLQERIATEGWGARFLSRRNENGNWGQRYYQPKWISTHYTLLDLKHLGISPKNPAIHETLSMVVDTEKAPDGGILPIGENSDSDVCVNGMFLNFATYFQTKEEDLKSVVDFLLAEHMPDGGFNCRSNRSGAVHSSLHSTISVAEGILEYARSGYKYRLNELQAAELTSREFILQHRLFKSDKTGEVIDKRMLMLSFPLPLEIRHLARPGLFPRCRSQI